MPSPDSSTETIDVNQGAESSASQATEAQGVAAESSTADEGVKAPATPLEAVKAALEATSSSDKTDKPATESPTRDADAKESKTSGADEPYEEEDKNFSKVANQRIRTLVEQRNAAQSRLEEVTKTADAYTAVVERVRATGASAAQIDEAMALLTEINRNPIKAFEMLTPIYQSLEQFVGNRLPSDLQEKVDSGHIDEDSAREIARLRNSSKFAETQHQQFVQQTQQQTDEDSLKSLKNAIGQASTDWDAKWKGSDPDYQRKLPFVMAEIRAQIAEAGGITSPQQAVKIADAALKKVNESLTGLMPQKREIKTPTGGFQSGNAAPKPRTALEAANLALRQG
jgi:hypothetical protein